MWTEARVWTLSGIIRSIYETVLYTLLALVPFRTPNTHEKNFKNELFMDLIIKILF